MSPEQNTAAEGVLIGIPAFNEASTIGDVVAEAQPYAAEVLVVDDGSDDETKRRAISAGATVIAHGHNQGYGAALETIFQYALETDVEQLVILDADGQHDIVDIPDLLQTLTKTDAEIVTGSRFNGKESKLPLYRRFGLAVINTLTNISLRVGYSYPSVSDTQCGFRAYNREAIQALAAAEDIGSGMGASLDILFTAARKGFEITEVPTDIDYEVEAANTRNPVLHGIDLMLALLIGLARDRPRRLASFALLSVVSVATVALSVAQLDNQGVFLLIPAFVVFVVGGGVVLLTDSYSQSETTKRE